MRIYHGSEKIIQNPKYGFGNNHNDYGQGFYTTEDYDLAGEWACKHNLDGFINFYDIDIKGLKILDLQSEEYNVLHWITLLINNRIFNLDTPIANKAKKYLIDNFSLDIKKFDMIIGYRADDSYFSYAKGFLDNTLSLKDISYALKLGKLGLQIVIISKKAFDRIEFEAAMQVKKDEYYKRFISRDNEARETYNRQIKKNFNVSDIRIADILKYKGDVKELIK